MEVIETYQSIPNEEGIYSKTTIYKKGFETIIPFSEMKL